MNFSSIGVMFNLKNKKTRVISVASAIIILVMAFSYYDISVKTFSNKERTHIVVDDDDDIDSVRNKVKETADGVNMVEFDLLTRIYDYENHINAGVYEISDRITTHQLVRNLRYQLTGIVNLVVPAVRTMNDLAGRLSNQISLDSLTLVNAFTNDSVCRSVGFSRETIPALFVPNTYEVFWNMSVERFLGVMKSNYERFWNAERKDKAKALGMTPVEVATLASIVDAETSADKEKPRIAGLYINRLKKDMFLQSDPTVIFALSDFSIKRVLYKHLSIDSPYNTYKVKGLPPGPIRVASIKGIDAVLNYEHHNYIFMCAKEDLSGTHNFAETSTEHSINARKYQQALNTIGIKK